MQKIHFILTGGTIDSIYNGIKDTVEPSTESSIPTYVESLRLTNIECRFTTVCMKDSRSLNIGDREHIMRLIKDSTEENILITHGTYTMPDTARFLKANLEGAESKKIILTGSMIPLVGFSPSDAPFNLGFSIAKFTTISPGVYVCMNGNLLNPEEVIKDLSNGKFISIFNT